MRNTPAVAGVVAGEPVVAKQLSYRSMKDAKRAQSIIVIMNSTDQQEWTLRSEQEMFLFRSLKAQTLENEVRATQEWCTHLW